MNEVFFYFLAFLFFHFLFIGSVRKIKLTYVSYYYYYYYYYDLFASRNAYKINQHINITRRQQRTTENTLSDKQ